MKDNEELKADNKKLKKIMKEKAKYIKELERICCKECHFYRSEDCAIDELHSVEDSLFNFDDEVSVIDYTKEKGRAQVKIEKVKYYFVDDEEWVKIRMTRVKNVDMPRKKSCFRRESPTENWSMHH